MSDLYQSLSHFEMELQIPYRVRAQAATPGAVGSPAPPIGSYLPRSGATKGVSDCGRALDAGPRAYVHRDSPQAPSGVGDWILKGKSHCSGPTVR